MKRVHMGGFTGCRGGWLRDAVTVGRTKRPAYKIVRAASHLSFGEWLAARAPGDLIVCGFDAPWVAVAAALYRGEPFEGSLQTWLEEASQALTLAEAEPGMMILVNVSAVQADPAGLAHLLTARTGMRIVPSKAAQVPEAGLIYGPLAERLLAGRKEVDEIYEELSATALIDGGFEPTREQMHMALEAARLEAEARDQAAREHAALVGVLGSALTGPAEAKRALSGMDSPGDADAAKALENLQRLIESSRRNDEDWPVQPPASPLAAGLAEAGEVLGAYGADATETIAEILALAAEDVQRAHAETRVLEDALNLYREEAQSRVQPVPNLEFIPDAEHAHRLQTESTTKATRALEDAPRGDLPLGADRVEAAAGLVAGCAGSPALTATMHAPNLITVLRDYMVVRRSTLFNAEWYRNWYADLQGLRDPVMHFVLHGAREGRAASAYFSAFQYRAEYPDVARLGVNPLVHYELKGRKERRRIFPVVEAFQPAGEG